MAATVAAIAWQAPAWLALLPLALLPWRRGAHGTDALAAPSLARLPDDAASRWIERALRAAGSVAIAALAVSLAGPMRPESRVERIATGAEIVLLLDRSRSMDQAFAGGRAGDSLGAAGGAPRDTRPETLERYMRMQGGRSAGESKAKVARRLIAEFAARRPADRFAVIGFSTQPLPPLDFTARRAAIDAAIRAGAGARGLAETDIGQALDAGLALFEARPYTASRVLMLVSDGGDHIEPDTRTRLAERMRRARVRVQWLYLRAINAPSLQDAADSAGGSAESVPEVFLDRWLASTGVPYKVHEADDADALRRAIDEIDRLEKLPIASVETLPRRPLAPWLDALALAATLVLLAAAALRARRWA